MAINDAKRSSRQSIFDTSYFLVTTTFLVPPGGFEPPTCDLGNAFQTFAGVRRCPRKNV